MSRSFRSFFSFSKSAPISRIGSRRSKTLIALAAGAGIVGLTSSPTHLDPLAVETYTDPVRHAAIATARSSRVIAAAVLCFNDYRVSLDKGEEQMSQCHLKCAKRVLKVLEKNGGIYIKLGQHISAMSYLLPIEWTSTMTVLQDHCPASTIDELKTMFLKDTGKEFDNVFDDLDEQPIGVASLAQVHRARLRSTGQEVAIKFQHPDLAEFSQVDMATTRYTFVLIKRLFPEFSLMWLSEEMDISLPQELNFTVEAANAVRTKEYFKGVKHSSLYVPEIVWAEPRILVMEYIKGARVDDLEFLAKHNIDRNDVSAELARAFNEMIFFAPALHCDPHGGNVFIRPRTRGSSSRFNFEIVLLDHGLYREIDLVLRRNYAHLWQSIIDSDMDKMAEYAYKVAGVKGDQFPLFASAITGRDFTAITQSITKTPRSEDEMKRINSVGGQDLLKQLVGLLSTIPRILLLLLKTNDLTRALDESLHTTTGPERPFIILAKACNKVVYQEDRETARLAGGIWGLFKWVKALFHYSSMMVYLDMAERWSTWRTVL